MTPSSFQQTTGNVCAALAVVVFLWPLQKLIFAYADKHLSNDQWVAPILSALIPLWLLLLGGLLCAAAGGGFEWLRLGRTAQYAFCVGAALGMATVSFVFIGLFVRPGMTPSFLYWPPLFLAHLATVLLVVLSLNPGLAPGGSPGWLRWPWTIFAGLGLIGCVIFFTPRILRAGAERVAEIAARILPEGPASPEQLAKIATLDPRDEDGFAALLDLADVYHHPEVREAATARLRSLPDFTARLVAELGRGRSWDSPQALEFVEAATLSPEEKAKFAQPTRAALEMLIERIPPPHFMTSERRKQLLRWGRRTFPAIAKKFEGTGVDFSKIVPEFEHALRPDDSRR